MQKIRAMSPEDQAVTQVLVNELHGRYADADMRKMLGAMNQASRNKQMDRRYELGRGRLDLDKELGGKRLSQKEDIYDFEKDQYKTAENLGWGNIALSGLTGYADMRNRKKLSKDFLGLISMYKK
jgi:hypothetical protein